MEIMFETERLIARKFRDDDARKLYENHLDDEVRKWFLNECYADIDITKREKAIENLEESRREDDNILDFFDSDGYLFFQKDAEILITKRGRGL